MQINKVNNGTSFKSVRKDMQFVSQLMFNQHYSLAENNQKNILKSIANISERGSVSGTRFLLDVAKNIRFATNIDFNKAPKNNWLAVLMSAVSASALKAGLSDDKQLMAECDKVFNTKKPLQPEEVEILESFNGIMEQLQLKAVREDELEAIKNNLQYFIISSETSLGDKKYILEKLNYFLTDDYKINPQLADKKVQVFSEIINDLALDKVSGDIPNTKAVDQNTLGTCASISIVRKLLAYEYKRNFVDVILSELDDTDSLTVYDRKQLGSGKQIQVEKAKVDYVEALNTGFRVIDASVAHWMNFADMPLNGDKVSVTYIPFDKDNLNSYRDSHVKFLSPKTGIMNEYEYYQALSVTLEKLKSLKSHILEQKANSSKSPIQKIEDIAKENGRLVSQLKRKVSNILAPGYKELAPDIVNSLLKLEKKNSEAIKSEEFIAKDFLYLPNEEEPQKKSKIKSFLIEGYYYALNSDVSDDVVEKLYADIESINSIKTTPKLSKFAVAKKAVAAADAYRHHVMKACNIPSRLTSYLAGFGVKDEDTRFLENLDDLLVRVEKKKDKVIIEGISKNIGIEPSKEGVIEFLTSAREYVASLPSLYDSFYARMNLVDRKTVLLKELKAGKKILDEGNRKNVYELMSAVAIFDEDELASRLDKGIDILLHKKLVDFYAGVMGCEANKETVFKTLKAVISNLSDVVDEEVLENFADALNVPCEDVMQILIEDASVLHGDRDEEAYAEAASLINQFGIKKDFFNYYSTLVNTFASGVDNQFLQTLFENNGYDKDSEPLLLQELMDNLIQDINDMATKVNEIARCVFVESKDGDIINSIYPPHIVIQECEKAGLVLKPSESKKFNEHFDRLAKLSSEEEKYSKQEFKKLKREITTLSSNEKDLVNMILANTNTMFRLTERERQHVFDINQDKFEEIFREYGKDKGKFWVSLTPSSGLSSIQQIHILESITDKPYFYQKNLKKGFEQIKGGKHSGISTTSVSDSKPAWHAQYIASIDTLKVPSKSDPNSLVEKDVLFHDNSWGRHENKNTWEDSRGLKRTDYNGAYGYKYGYITNDYLRNGTFTDDLLAKVGKNVQSKVDSRVWKKLNPPEDYAFDLMDGIVLPGKSSRTISLAKSLKDAVFSGNSEHVRFLEETAANMSPDELRTKLKKLNEIELAYQSLYDSFVRTIKANPSDDVSKDFAALPENGPLRILLEKAALRKTFPEIVQMSELSSIDSLEELVDYREELINRSMEKVSYAFAKDVSLANYFIGEDNLDKFIQKVIEPQLQKLDIVLEADDIDEMFEESSIVEEMKSSPYFDGSLNSFAKIFSNVIIGRIIDLYDEDAIPNADVADLREAIFEHVVNEILFNEKKIDDSNVPSFIIDWIDKTFAPETQEEFTKVYRDLQNADFAEFKKMALSRFSKEDLNLQEVTALDIFKGIRAEKSFAEDALFNETFGREFKNAYGESEMIPHTRYDKYSNKVTGAYYGKRQFEEIYYTVKFDLEKLEYKRLFDKHKIAALKRYNVLPAYPFINDKQEEVTISSLDFIKKSFNKLSSLRGQIRQFEAVGVIYSIASASKEHVLSDGEVMLLQDEIKTLLSLMESDTSFKEYSEVLSQLTTLKEGDKLDKFIPAITAMHDKSRAFLRLCTESEYEVKRQLAEEDLNKTIKTFLMLKVLPQYRSRVNVKINEWVRSLRESSPETQDRLYNEILDMVDKYHVQNSGGSLLSEFLINTALTDADSKMLAQAYGAVLKSALQASKFIEVQEVMMRAMSAGVASSMASEFDNIDVVLDKFDIETGASTERIVYKMSSPQVLDMMVRSLILEDNYEISKQFVENLNLEEKVVPLFIDSQEFKEAEKAFKELKAAYADLQKEEKVMRELYTHIKSLPKLNAEGIKNQAKEYVDFLRESGIDLNDDFYISNAIATLENMVENGDFATYAKLNTVELFVNVLDAVNASTMQDVATQLNSVNDDFVNLGLIYDFLNTLNLSNFSELQAKLKEYNKKVDAMLDEQNCLMEDLNSLKFFAD